MRTADTRRPTRSARALPAHVPREAASPDRPAKLAAGRYPTRRRSLGGGAGVRRMPVPARPVGSSDNNQKGELIRSEEHTSELQSHSDFVCRLLLKKKKVAT